MKEEWIDIPTFLEKYQNNKEIHLIPVVFYSKPRIFNRREYDELLDQAIRKISATTVRIINSLKNIDLKLVTVSTLIPTYKSRQKQLRSGRSIKIAKRTVIIDFPIGLFVVIKKSVPYEIFVKVKKEISKYEFYYEGSKKEKEGER